MYKPLTTLLLYLLILACKSPQKETPIISEVTQEHPIKKKSFEALVIDSIKLGVNFKPKGTYAEIKALLIHDREGFKKFYESNPKKAIDSASKFIYHKLINDIVPHWYNTPWDFNGHTNIPNDGNIACGYFVSTTLKHLGFNLNRYRMAQQGGLNESKTLQDESDIKVFSNLSFKDLKQKLNEIYTNGVYFVGLDNHVGYVLIKDREIYFLHSSYYENKVMIEFAERSPCFRSNMYVFAEISTNRELVKKWILNEKLEVPIS